jgi:arylsulfatase A-like enzyme
MHYPHAPHRSDYFTAYRNGDWKVIYHYFPTQVSENSHYQLFNLKADPFEQTNLAKTEPAQLKRLMQELIAGLEKQNALYPVDKATGETQKPKLP